MFIAYRGESHIIPPIPTKSRPLSALPLSASQCSVITFTFTSRPLAHCRYVRPGRGYVPNFQLFAKDDVNGEKEQKIFTFLKSPLQHSCPHPSEVVSTNKHISWEPVKEHDIRWNFEKFLVGPTGVPVMRWSHLAPVSAVKADIVAYLKQFKTK
ncbi:Epididymal secretory glutathione peroxidase [Lemmus lemmus]